MKPVLVLMMSALGAWAQGRTVLDGVYAEEQAGRGQGVYAQQCAGCHGDVLQGKSDGPLRGQVFMDRWREDTLDVLFRHIRTNMPARAKGSLPEDTYLDLVSFILQANGFPPGAKALTAPDTASILLVGRDGPKPLPTNATVKVVGCLNAGAGGAFTLGRAGTLARTPTGDVIEDGDRQWSGTAALGTSQYRLGNMDDTRPGFTPDQWGGHKVIAKGVLTRQSSGDRIHVLSMASLAASCAP